MASICGRDCENCQDRIAFGCRGCLQSEGTPYWGKCGVVSCCHGKGMQRCTLCKDLSDCDRSASAEEERAGWQRQQQADRLRQESRRAELRCHAPVLARWLLVLFWTNLFSSGITLLGRMKLQFATLMTLNIVLFLIGLVSFFAYWKLSPLSARFRSVWRCQVAVLGIAPVTLVAALLAGPAMASQGASVLRVVIGLISSGAAVAVIYFFCEAMAEQLDELNRGLAENWRLLRKWELALLGITFGCILLISLLAVLVVIIMLLSTIGLLICRIANPVLLWQSAKAFKALALETALPPSTDIT